MGDIIQFDWDAGEVKTAVGSILSTKDVTKYIGELNQLKAHINIIYYTRPFLENWRKIIFLIK